MNHNFLFKFVTIIDKKDLFYQFSSALVNHLDSKTDSDTVRAASLEEHIQERVAVEIERLHAKERDILIEVEKELARKNAQYEKAQEKLNSFELKDEISSLEKSIEGMFQIKKLDDTLLEKKKEVIQCLKQNGFLYNFYLI